MITLKEYEIYLKVKKSIETENCEEKELIPKLINGVGIIPAYIPLIIVYPMTWNQLNITPYQLLQEGVEFLSKQSSMPIGIGVRK